MKKIYDAEVQYLLIEEARDVGLNALNMVVDTDENGLSAQECGLTPLLVYCIVAPAYRVIARKLVPADEPIPISAFLAEAWSKMRGLGMPMRLEMKKTLHQADKGFSKWAASLGISCAPVRHHGALAAYSAYIRQVQFPTLGLARGDDAYKPNLLNDSNARLAAFDLKYLDVGFARASGALTEPEEITFKAWINRGQKFFENAPTLPMDWACEPLRKAAKVPPSSTHGSRPYWLVNRIDGLEDVAAMWPAGTKQFCSDLGLTVKQWQRWLSGALPIEEWQYDALREKVHLAGEDPLMDPDDSLSLVGGFLLVADSVHSAVTLYRELAWGEKFFYSFEAISTTTDFGGFRVLLLGSDINILTILLFIRGSEAETLLTRSHLHDFQGPIDVPEELANRLNDAIRHRLTNSETGHVGCQIESEFGDWLESHAVQLDDGEDSDGEDDSETVNAMRELAVNHWAMETDQLAEIRKALALRSPEQALLQIVKDAFGEGIDMAMDRLFQARRR